MNPKDTKLGMDRDITRRDFLNGVTIAVGGSLLNTPLAALGDAASGKMSYFSRDWSDEKKLWLAGRRRSGRIAFANTDAGASAMTEAAIEQAHRATREVLNES